MNSAPLIKAEFSKETYAKHYASLSEFLSAIQQPVTLPFNVYRMRQLFDTGHPNPQVWYGAESQVAAIEIIDKGWQAGADKVEAAYQTLAPALPRALSVRRKRRLGEQGDEIDIDALQRHDYSKLWIGFASQLRPGLSTIRIVVDICGHCGESAERLQRQGIAALCLSRILSRAGYSVEIVTALCVANAVRQRGKKNTVITVTVKAANSRPDVQQLAATAAFPGFFRIPGFKAIVHAANAQGKDVEPNLGRPVAAENLIAPSSKMLQIVTPTFANEAAIKVWLEQAIRMFQGSKR